MRQRLRKAQRQMRGVKLQYTEEQRPIMFDDVAGIGEAKASRIAFASRCLDSHQAFNFGHVCEKGCFRSQMASLPQSNAWCMREYCLNYLAFIAPKMPETSQA